MLLASSGVFESSIQIFGLNVFIRVHSWLNFFSALFIAAAARFNSRMANLHIQSVQSLDAPELALYLTLKRAEEHERAGVLVAANIKVVKRLLASRYTVVSALLTPAWLEKLEPQLRARPEMELPVYVAEQKVLETITGYKLHQGALAVAKIPPLPDFETLLNNSPRPLLLAAVEGIASAENLGAVVRSCAAFGAHFLIVGETCGSPFQRRAVAGSMGTIFEQPLVRVDNLVETLKACARAVCVVWRRIHGQARRNCPPWICAAIAVWCLARKDRA